MDIIIEIGTSEQKKLITQELNLLGVFSQELDPPIPLTRVIVAENFEEKVNEVEGITTYKANKGLENISVSAIGRICRDGEGYAVVVSPLLYTQRFDTSIRYFILLHEIAHVLNKRDFPPIPTDPFTNKFYANSIYNLFDEYYADRFAYKMCDSIYPEKSHFWDEYLDTEIKGFIEILIDPSYYEIMKVEIEAFRHHADADEFLKKVHSYYDMMAIVLSHTFAIYHQYPNIISRVDIAKSKFVNAKTERMMNYFSKKYEDKSVDLADGMDLIIDFMTNFGIKFEHRDYGAYCHVLDI